ncbi:MAG: 50S ribosomal protein L13 [Nanoarchaeota archaeon]|nr:50S ribosomal protein L13 [Nanoarchaeota archaeon]
MMSRVFIDGNNGVLGRVAARAAKSALEGNHVFIFNAEKLVVSGDKTYLLNRYLDRIHRGESVHGPFFPKTSKGIVKRTVRGMLPYKSGKGRQAFKRVKVYEGVPEQFSNEKLELPSKLKEDFKTKKYLRIKNISQRIGGK